MHLDNLQRWQHSHTFGQDRRRPGESRTLVVIGITGAMMVVEVAAGIVFGSMALLADGLHMASHAAALGIAAFAYAHARRQAASTQYCFGTGKVNALGGYTGAVLLAVFALLMAWGSLGRLIHPVDIGYNQAILVAVVGLAVNGVCVLILGVKTGHREHDAETHTHDGHSHDHEDRPHDHPHHQDHNLKSAYLHVMADALTSVLAIAALLAAKYLGYVWMDPVTGIVGALLVARWSVGLVRTTSGVLLDRQGPESIRAAIRRSVEEVGDSQVVDLHLWSTGPGLYAAIVSVVAHEPATPEEYKARLPADLGLAHVSVEVHRCAADPGAG